MLHLQIIITPTQTNLVHKSKLKKFNSLLPQLKPLNFSLMDLRIMKDKRS